MLELLPDPLKKLARALPFPLYLVGGSVRDFLRGALQEKPDYDICSYGDESALVETALSMGFTVK